MRTIQRERKKETDWLTERETDIQTNTKEVRETDRHTDKEGD